MKVTDLNFFIGKPKINVLNWMCSRVSGKKKFQNVIITEGREGYGKSTLTAIDAYYMAYTLRRKLTLFFDIETLNNYAIKAKDEILIWDDVALAGLSLEGYNETIVKLIKILMLARKNRNTFFLNIQELWRMKEPLIARAIAMNHVYSADGLRLGTYVYFNEVQMRYMYDMWQRKKRKSYKFYSFRDTFPDMLGKIFDEGQYDKLKDKAILSIKASKRGKPAADRKMVELQLKIANCDMTDNDKIKYFNLTRRTLENWRAKGRMQVAEATAPDLNHQNTSNKDNVLYIRPKDESYLSCQDAPIILVNPLKKNKLAKKESVY